MSLTTFNSIYRIVMRSSNRKKRTCVTRPLVSASNSVTAHWYSYEKGLLVTASSALQLPQGSASGSSFAPEETNTEKNAIRRRVDPQQLKPAQSTTLQYRGGRPLGQMAKIVFKLKVPCALK